MKKIIVCLLAITLAAATSFAQPKLMSASAENEYSIVYELNGGTNNSANSENYIENTTVTLKDPQRSGYRFDGWYWDESFKNKLENNTFSQKKGALKVFAKWIKNLDTTSFERDNMVVIIPAGQKVLLEDFANTKGPQNIGAYAIAKYEVTQELYNSFVGINPSEYKNEKNPVENVTWYDAVYFCNELTKQIMKEDDCCYRITNIRKNDNGNIERADVELIEGKKGYRLPTEAEWEMAARGGTKGGWDYKYSGANDWNSLKEFAWCSSNSEYKPHPVGTKKPNAAGLYDMSGNVWELCWDFYYSDNDYYRVSRGGGYDGYCEVTYRNDTSHRSYSENRGFRVCRSL